MFKRAVIERYKCQWTNIINKEQSRSGYGGNKSRTFQLFKQNLGTESYVKMILPQKRSRSSLSKFRSGVAPLHIETGRFERLAEEQRVCPFYRNCIEIEFYVIIKYNDIRNLYDTKCT